MCTSLFFPWKCYVSPTLNACLSHVESNTCAFAIMSFLWLCVCCVKQHACFTVLHSVSDQAADCYSAHFFFQSSFPLSYVKVKTLYWSPNPRSPWNILLPPTLLVSSYLASWQGLRWSWTLPPPLRALSPPCPCKTATVPVCSVQACTFLNRGMLRSPGVQRSSMCFCFWFNSKCFSWLNSLVLRSSYNKLKGPNCPQGRRLATIDMWWDKSPVLIPRYPHPTRVEEMNTSAVSVLYCG